MSTSLTQSQFQPLVTQAPSPALAPVWQRASQSVWRYLESVGRARAQDELRRLALSHRDTNPTLARQLRHALQQIT